MGGWGNKRGREGQNKLVLGKVGVSSKLNEVPHSVNASCGVDGRRLKVRSGQRGPAWKNEQMQGKEGKQEPHGLTRRY